MHAAEAHRARLRTESPLPVAPAARKRLMSRRACCGAASRPFAGNKRAITPTRPAGREAQHDQHQQRRRTAAGIGRASPSSSGSSTTTQAPIERTEHAIGAAEHDDQQEQDRLEERKRFRADEIADRGEDAAGNPGQRPPKCRTPSCGSSVGSRPIEMLADFGIAHRAHGIAPGAVAQPGERGDRQRRSARR